MHALRMPPRHFWRLGLLALLLTLAMTFATTELQGIELPSFGGDGSAAPATQAAVETSSGTPAWVEDPLRPATVELAR